MESPEPTTANLPQGSQATQVRNEGSVYVARQAPVATSQTRAVWSSDVDTTRARPPLHPPTPLPPPPPQNATPVTLREWRDHILRGAGGLRADTASCIAAATAGSDHTATVASSEAVASRAPSGESATAVTFLMWASHDAMRAPLRVSHTTTVPATVPPTSSGAAEPPPTVARHDIASDVGQRSAGCSFRQFHSWIIFVWVYESAPPLRCCCWPFTGTDWAAMMVNVWGSWLDAESVVAADAPLPQIS